MAVQIGINPITWTNDDMPELGGNTTLETCLAETRRAGFAGTEMGGKFPTTSSELAPLLKRHGLTFISGWYSGKLLSRDVDEEMQAMNDHLALLSEMRCRVMVFAEGTGATHGDRSAPASRRTEVSPGEWSAYAQRLTLLADRMQARGVRMAFHHHMGTPVQTSAEVDRLMSETGPSVGLLLDTGHALYAGADLLALARRHAGRVIHVHCKDIRKEKLQIALASDASFLDAIIDGVFTMPGDGCIDFLPILTVLREAGYAGWLVAEAEQDPVKAHPLTCATLGFRNLSALAKSAGFQVQ